MDYRPVSVIVSSFEDGTRQDADERIRCLEFVIKFFIKKKSNAVMFVKDKCLLDRSISKKLDLPLLGCTNCRFKLPVKEILTGEKPTAFQVQQIINKLCIALLYAKLRQKGHLEPRLKINKRWSSPHQKLLGYVHLREHALNLNQIKMDARLLNSAVECTVHALIKTLKDLDEVKKNYNGRVGVSEMHVLTLILCLKIIRDYQNDGILKSRIYTIRLLILELLKIKEFHEETIASLEKNELSRLLLNQETGVTVKNNGNLNHQAGRKMVKNQRRTAEVHLS